jgi:hypothetical protein
MTGCTQNSRLNEIIDAILYILCMHTVHSIPSRQTTVECPFHPKYILIISFSDKDLSESLTTD